MELTLRVDGRLPVTVRFGQHDFADVGKATAVEVAAGLSRTLPELVASAAAGRVVISSETVGNQSEMEMIPAPSSLVSLEGAPSGRLSTCTDSQGRVRVFYETWETATQSDTGAPSSTNIPSSAGNYVVRRVHYKTLLDGGWRDSHPIDGKRIAPQADPAAVTLSDDRIWTAWIDDPLTAGAAVRFAIGASRPQLSARVLGRRREPFALTDGAIMTVRGDWAGVDRFTVHKASFADVTRATAAEVVAAMNGQLAHVVATRERDGSIGLETAAGEGRRRGSPSISSSRRPRARWASSRATPWIAWIVERRARLVALSDAVSIAPGRHADLAAVTDPVAGVREPALARTDQAALAMIRFGVLA